MTLEGFEVALHLVGREKTDLPAAEHDRVLAAERLPGMVGRLAQVGGTRLGPQVRPQRLDGLITHQVALGGQGEELHELRRAAPRPPLRRHLPAPDEDPKPAE